MQVSPLSPETFTFSITGLRLCSLFSHILLKSQFFHSPPRLRIPTMFASQIQLLCFALSVDDELCFLGGPKDMNEDLINV